MQRVDAESFLYDLFFETEILEKFNLSERDKIILEMRWRYSHSFCIIANHLNLSHERVSQLYTIILNKIRRDINIFFKTVHIPVYIKHLTDEPPNTTINLDPSQPIYINLVPNFNPKYKAELARLNINTLQDLAKKTKRELLMHKRFGKKTVDELEIILKTYCLDFAA